MNMKKILGIIATAAIAAVSTTANAEHTWNNYHIARTSHPIPLQVIDSVDSGWQFLRLRTGSGPSFFCPLDGLQ